MTMIARKLNIVTRISRNRKDRYAVGFTGSLYGEPIVIFFSDGTAEMTQAEFRRWRRNETSNT